MRDETKRLLNLFDLKMLLLFLLPFVVVVVIFVVDAVIVVEDVKFILCLFVCFYLFGCSFVCFVFVVKPHPTSVSSGNPGISSLQPSSSVR